MKYINILSPNKLIDLSKYFHINTLNDYKKYRNLICEQSYRLYYIIEYLIEINFINDYFMTNNDSSSYLKMIEYYQQIKLYLQDEINKANDRQLIENEIINDINNRGYSYNHQLINVSNNKNQSNLYFKNKNIKKKKNHEYYTGTIPSPPSIHKIILLKKNIADLWLNIYANKQLIYPTKRILLINYHIKILLIFYIK